MTKTIEFNDLITSVPIPTGAIVMTTWDETIQPKHKRKWIMFACAMPSDNDYTDVKARAELDFPGFVWRYVSVAPAVQGLVPNTSLKPYQGFFLETTDGGGSIKISIAASESNLTARGQESYDGSRTALSLADAKKFAATGNVK